MASVCIWLFLTPRPPGQAFVAPERVPLLELLAISLFTTLLLTYFVVRSPWIQQVLAFGLFFAFFVTTFVGLDYDVLLGPDPFSQPLEHRVVAQAGLAWAFCRLAGAALRPWRRQLACDPPPPQTGLVSETAASIRLFALPVGYVFVYLVFQYAISCKSHVVRVHCGVRERGHFFAYLGEVLHHKAAFFLLLFFYGFLLVATAAWVIAMLRGPRWEVGLTVGLLLALQIEFPSLLPDPDVPSEGHAVRWVERTSANFFFG
jgi:hypothetical protein